MLDELLDYPADVTGHMIIRRGGPFASALILMDRDPDRIERRLLVAGGMAIVVYAHSLMLGDSPLMDWRLVAAAGVSQGLGLGFLMPALTKAALSTLDPEVRLEATRLFHLSRLYGSSIGVAVAQILVFTNTQAMHLALATELTLTRPPLKPRQCRPL